MWSYKLEETMGRSITPKYRVEFTTEQGYMTPQCWNGKWNGRANLKNLLKLVEDINASFGPGEINERAGKYVVRVTHARLIRQADSTLIANCAA